MLLTECLVGDLELRKTNSNIRCVKHIRKIIVFLIVQLLIALVFFFIFASVTDIDETKLCSSQIIVDGVEFEYKFMVGEMFRFTSDSVEYVFPKFPILGTDEYSMFELYNTINVGDVVFVEYTQKGDYNSVIGAAKGEQILRSKTAYLDYLRRQRIVTVVALVVVEVIFVLCLILFVWWNWKDFKRMFRKKKKHVQNNLNQVFVPKNE